MKKEVKKRLNKNYKLIIGMVIGIIISGIGAYAATTISSSTISYDNSKSGLTSTNLKGAIDELYEKSDIRKQGKYVSAYTYSTATSTKCITGEESTCKKTECYKTKTENSCKAGDIIKYKVNDTDIVTFHVMFDNGSTMTMQSQKNTVNRTVWYEDPGLEHKNEDVLVSDNTTAFGPLTALEALESVTETWVNVNNQTYTMGTTVFKTNAYTGCDRGSISCTKNIYTLPERTAKARMITLQEAVVLGCTKTKLTCPIWIANYLKYSAANGGTISITQSSDAIWTMNAEDSQIAVTILPRYLDHNYAYGWNSRFERGVRAVVVVNK